VGFGGDVYVYVDDVGRRKEIDVEVEMFDGSRKVVVDIDVEVGWGKK